MVGLLDVTEKEDLMITCVSGVTIRMSVASVSEQGRATQGVKLIRVDEGDSIAAITKLDEQEEVIVAEQNSDIILPADEAADETGAATNESTNPKPETE